MSIPPSNYDELSLRSAMTSTVRSFNTSFSSINPDSTSMLSKPSPKPKPKRYRSEISDVDLALLSTTLTELNIPSIINYSLDELTQQIDAFSIQKKEQFLTQLSGDFRESVTKFLFQLTYIDEKVDQMLHSGNADYASVNALNAGIQKIEEKNHRIELRNENKRKLQTYMNELLSQLTISPSKRDTLLTTEYIATSELVIVKEVLDNFVRFYKGRKKQNINMNIINESTKATSSYTVSSMN